MLSMISQIRHVAKSNVNAAAFSALRRHLATPAPEFQYYAEEDEISQCNIDYQGIVEIKEIGDHGLGVVSQKKFEKGDLIVRSSVVSVNEERDSHSIQKDWDLHIIIDLPGILINHSCEANVGIKDNDEAYDFIALRDIEEGEELTWDYESTEHELSSKFTCICGSPGCRKTINGFKTHGHAIRSQYGDFHANYLKSTKDA